MIHNKLMISKICRTFGPSWAYVGRYGYKVI